MNGEIKVRELDFSQLRKDLREMNVGDLVFLENVDEKTKKTVRGNVIYRLNKPVKRFETFSFSDDKLVIEKIKN